MLKLLLLPENNLMHFDKAARKLIVLALLFSFVLSGFAPDIAAQSRGRKTSRRAPSTASKPASEPLRRQLPGTAHQSPARTYDVQHYTIRTRFDASAKTVFGDVTVSLKPLANGFQNFKLDASNMEFDTVTLEPEGKRLKWTTPEDKLYIALDRAYSSSETIEVRIRYRANPQRGLYFVPATPASRGRRWAKPAQIWTQGEPEDNHHWFPCYDFPDDKATSEQFITTSASEIAISNGELIETVDNGDSTRTFHWKMNQPHSSYLISLVVGNYSKIEDAYKNIPVEYYTYPGTERKARSSFAKTPAMMRWFIERLNYEYPYNKYAQTVVTNFIFGGMENITATTQADTEILSGEDDDPSLSADNLVAHELSHSWFGNLATAKDWANLWVNEGFATFFEAAFNEHEGGRDAYLYELREDSSEYFSEDSFQYRRPIVSNRYRNPVDLFDATVYKKGGFVVHMLRETVGDEVFWRALNVYLNEHKYQNTDVNTVKDVFENVSGKDLDWFFDQWLFKAGYPELRVRQTYNAATRQLTLDVQQTQTPDSITPAIFRLPGVEVEIRTAKGTINERVDITERSSRFVFKLDSRPLAVRFDKGERILKKLDFPQQRAALILQLLEGTDAIARIEAAEALAQLRNSSPEDEREIIQALGRALRKDSFFGVRAAAATALGEFKTEEAVRSLNRGTRDEDQRVREAALKEFQKAIGAHESAARLESVVIWLKERSNLARGIY